MERKQLRPLSQYLVALIAPSIALGMTIAIPLLRTNTPIAFFFVAVSVIAMLGEWGPALLCLGFSIFLVQAFVIPAPVNARELGILSVFIAVSIGLIYAFISQAKAEREAARTLALLKAFMESAPVGFALHDSESRFVDLNHQLELMMNRPRSSLVGKTLDEVLPDFSRKLEAFIREATITGKPVTFEFEGDTEGFNRERHWVIRYFPITTKGGQNLGIGAAIVDSTEQRRNERGMRETEKLSAAGKLAASVAHEINNPLEAVTNLLFLAQSLAGLPQPAKEYLSLADEELQRVTHLTRKTLGFYRESKLPAVVDIQKVIEEITFMYARRVAARNISVTCNLKSPLYVVSLEGELRQVLANLYANALDAVKENGRVLIRAKKAQKNGKAGVRITIADDGHGISDENMHSIWQAFFTTKNDTGTGLGLWLTKEIIVRHEGSIRFRSRSKGVSTGTVFSLFLPSLD